MLESTWRLPGLRRLTTVSPMTETHGLPSPGLVMTWAGDEPTLPVRWMFPVCRLIFEITWSNQWVTETRLSSSSVQLLCGLFQTPWQSEPPQSEVPSTFIRMLKSCAPTTVNIRMKVDGTSLCGGSDCHGV